MNHLDQKIAQPIALLINIKISTNHKPTIKVEKSVKEEKE